MLSYYLPRLGGVENAAFQLAKGLQNDGFLVRVLTSNSLGHGHPVMPKGPRFIENHIVHRFPSIRLPLSILFNKSQSIPLSPGLMLSPLLHKAKLNNVHIPHQFIGELNLLSSMLSKRPTILTVHNYEVSASTFEQNIFKILDLLTTTLQNYVDRIVVATKKFKQRYFSNKLSSKVHVIPYGLDHARFNYKNRLNMEYLDKKRTKFDQNILFVSVLDEAHSYKGLNWLLKAMSHFLKDHPRAGLNIVGSGNLKEKIEKEVAKSELKRQIKFYGRVSDKELDILYHTSDVLVLPSISELEGFGLVALEAIGSGTPVIVSDICGVSEIVENLDFGEIVSPFGSLSNLKLMHWYERISSNEITDDYPFQISNAIDRVINKDWNDQRVKVAEKIEKNYTWFRYVAEYSKLFSKFF